MSIPVPSWTTAKKFDSYGSCKVSQADRDSFDWIEPHASQLTSPTVLTATTFYYMGVQYTTATGINTSNHLHLKDGTVLFEGRNMYVPRGKKKKRKKTKHQGNNILELSYVANVKGRTWKHNTRYKKNFAQLIAIFIWVLHNCAFKSQW